MRNDQLAVALRTACKEAGHPVIEHPATTGTKPALPEEVVQLQLPYFVLKLEGYFREFFESTYVEGKVQVQTSSGGGSGPRKPAPPPDAKYEMVTVDIDNLMQSVSVHDIRINVASCEGRADYYKIFVNCEVGASPQNGFNEWGKSNNGVYEKLIRRIIGKATWEVATLRNVNEEDKAFLNLRKRNNRQERAVVRFNIADGGE